MSFAIAEIERHYTLEQAAEVLGFPSPDALRMYLRRRPGLVVERYRRAGRLSVRLLTETEVRHLIALLITTR